MDQATVNQLQPQQQQQQQQNQKFTTPPRTQNHQYDYKSYRIPEPKQFRSLILPSRTYFTFAREGMY